MSAGGASGGPVIGGSGDLGGKATELGEKAGAALDQLREAGREAMAEARKGAHAKEEQLWARYRELRRRRRRGEAE